MQAVFFAAGRPSGRPGGIGGAALMFNPISRTVPADERASPLARPPCGIGGCAGTYAAHPSLSTSPPPERAALHLLKHCDLPSP